MKIDSVQMTATLWVAISQENMDAIWDCAENHYDSTVQKMTRPGGVLFGIRNQLGESKSTQAHLNFRDLDTMAKALEMSHYSAKAETRDSGVKLHGEIHEMLRFINSQASVRDL
jgi:hypothetical protein